MEESVVVSINLDGEVVHDIGNFARRLDMTNLEYIRKGILYFNTLNKRKLLIDQMSQGSIVGQKSTILTDLKNQEKSHFIL